MLDFHTPLSLLHTHKNPYTAASHPLVPLSTLIETLTGVAGVEVAWVALELVRRWVEAVGGEMCRFLFS